MNEETACCALLRVAFGKSRNPANKKDIWGSFRMDLNSCGV